MNLFYRIQSLVQFQYIHPRFPQNAQLASLDMKFNQRYHLPQGQAARASTQLARGSSIRPVRARKS